MAKTKIEWAEYTWNPVTGCTPVSEGCENCYAARMARRLRGRYGYPADDPFRVTLREKELEAPLRLLKPRRVFVCSMGDLFHESVPVEFIERVWSTMLEADRHTFLVLTKRAGRMASLVGKSEELSLADNIWLGVTAENQRRADERIPALLGIPAAVRFVSVEPMLEPINLYQYLYILGTHNPPLLGRGLDWVICGGETGPGARPLNPEWVYGLCGQCALAGVPFFFKSWGDWSAVRRIDGVADLSKLKSNQRVAKAHNGGYWLFARVGKKKAGRLISGHPRDGMPGYETP